MLGQETDSSAREIASEVGEDLAARFELLDPGERDVGDCGGGDDAVVGAVLGDPGRAVARDERGLVSEQGEADSRLVDQTGVDVDTHNVVAAETVGEEGGVVAGS